VKIATEVECKLEVSPDFAVPDLGGIRRVVGVSEPEEYLLEATYFDTADLRLARARHTLRRRTGGPDAGWHLKRPAGSDREEIRLPLGRATRTVPADIRPMTAAITRGRALVPVARLTTRRSTVRLLDRDGQVLAEISDDHVSAVALFEDAVPDEWREIEVELVGGRRSLLADVVQRLTGAGAAPATARRSCPGPWAAGWRARPSARSSRRPSLRRKRRWPTCASSATTW
jgi:inorganic triphosphatase YgiF